MKTRVVKTLSAGVLACAMTATIALAQAAPSAAPAPRLAPDVKPQAGYERVTERFVLANPTQIYSDILVTSPATGELTSLGKPVTPIAKVKDWDWYLVGRDGVGIGYISRGVLAPAARSPK